MNGIKNDDRKITSPFRLFFKEGITNKKYFFEAERWFEKAWADQGNASYRWRCFKN